MASKPRPPIDCAFCEIVAGRASATLVAEWGEAVAIVPLAPVVEGHTLIIPRLHVRDATTRPEITASTMYRAAEFASRYPSSNIIASTGRAATQSVDHLHVHVIPQAGMVAYYEQLHEVQLLCDGCGRHLPCRHCDPARPVPDTTKETPDGR